MESNDLVSQTGELGAREVRSWGLQALFTLPSLILLHLKIHGWISVFHEATSCQTLGATNWTLSVFVPQFTYLKCWGVPLYTWRLEYSDPSSPTSRFPAWRPQAHFHPFPGKLSPALSLNVFWLQVTGTSRNEERWGKCRIVGFSCIIWILTRGNCWLLKFSGLLCQACCLRRLICSILLEILQWKGWGA